MVQRLHGKVAVITGALSDIGFAIARRFVEEGATVLLSDVVAPDDVGYTKELASFGNRAAFMHGDASVEADIAILLAEAKRRWGGVTTAVSAARWSAHAAVPDHHVADWDRAMAVNAKGAFFLAKHAIPQMLEAGSGAIIFISSVHASVGRVNNSSYSASKGALRSMAKGLAAEYAGTGIRANAVSPGVIITRQLRTRVQASDNPEALMADVMRQQPGGRAGEPDDIAWSCVYLASDEARFVSGTELLVDCALVAA